MNFTEIKKGCHIKRKCTLPLDYLYGHGKVPTGFSYEPQK